METFFYISHFLGEIFSGNTFMSPPHSSNQFFSKCVILFGVSHRRAQFLSQQVITQSRLTTVPPSLPLLGCRVNYIYR